MSGVPYHYVHALVQAHCDRDAERFRKTVLQIAARTPAKATQLQNLVNAIPMTMQLLDLSLQKLVHEAPSHDVDLMLPGKLVTELDDVVREWGAMGALLEVGLRPRSRLLFYGPPGNGKTTAAAQLARRIGLSAYVCSITQVVNSDMGGSGKAIEKALSLINVGHALILDEVDAVGSSRFSDTTAAGHEGNRIVSAMLTALDRTHGGLLIATTNRLDMLDAALVRRFDECLEFPGPDKRVFWEFIDRLSAGFGLRPEQYPDWNTLSSYDAATKAVHKAARRAVLDRGTSE